MSGESTFESIDHDEQPGVGPEGVLLSGFATEEISAVRDLLSNAGLPAHRTVRCSEAALERTLEQALSAERPGPPIPADKLPRVMILSGMTGKQIHAVIDAWKSTGLARPVWASTTPTNLGYTVKALLRELLAEQRAMAEQRGAAAPPPPPKGRA